MTIRQTLVAAGSCLLIAGPVSALAGDFYIGASLGSATLSEDFDGLNVNDSSTALRLMAGWRVNDFFSLEGGYNDFGDFEQVSGQTGGQSKVRLSADGFIVGATGRIPVSGRFALTGRAGMFFWNGTAEINNVSQATPEDSNLYLGAGLDFEVSSALQLTVDWTRYELESATSGVASVGLRYRFR